jgi:transposase
MDTVNSATFSPATKEKWTWSSKVVVPDQLRSAVKGPNRYDPEINPTYADLAQYYDMASVPARAGEPRDKTKVEGGVRIAQRWIMVCLRNHTLKLGRAL